MAKKKLGSTKLTDDLIVTSVDLTTDVTGVLPVGNGGTGITALGTGVATALGVNVGTAGSFVVNGGALGTPSSGTLTNATGLPIVAGTTGTLTAARGGTGITSLGTGVATALGINVGTAGAFVTFNGALGTPSTGTLTNATGLPIIAGTTGTLTVARGGTGLTAGTSGGVPYYSSTTAMTSSALLNADRIMLGGGAGNPPKTMADAAIDFMVLVGFTTGEPDWMYITSGMWDSTLLNQFGLIVAGTPGTETANAIDVTYTVVQGPNGGGALASTNSVVRVIVSDSATDCSPSATATISAASTPLGILLEGSGTATATFRTAAAGTFSIKVTETAVASRFIWVEQGASSQVYLKAAATPLQLTFA